MEALGPKLRRQRRRLGLTLDELAGRTAISKPYLSLIETGRVPNPPSDDKLTRLEQSLGFATGELVTQAHLQRTPRDVRAVLNQLLQDSDEEAPKDSTGMLHRLVGKSSEMPVPITTNAVPVINKTTGGYPTDFTAIPFPFDNADDYISCPDVQDKDAFAARVVGDSMSPKFTEGNIVIFSPALSGRSGDDCFIRFEDGQTTFRRIFFESDDNGQPSIRLQPRNEKYRPQIVTAEKIAGMHRAVVRYERLDD